MAAGQSLLSEASLQQGDVVTLSPVPPSFMHDADSILLKLLPKSNGSSAAKITDRKGKGKAREESREVLSELFVDVLGTVVPHSRSWNCC